MTVLRETQKKYCSRAMAASVFISLVFILLDHKAIGKGLVFGTIFSVVNFVLMAETLPARIGQKKRKTFLLSLGSIFSRFMILAIPVFVAIKFDGFNFPATVAGLFAVQIMIFFEHLAKLFVIRSKKQI